MRKRGEGGWFTIPGLQEGERTLEEGVRGLEPLAEHAEGASVLDLGCAEGLIGQWFLEHWAYRVDGLDASKPMLDVGRSLAGPLPMTLQWADFNAPGTWPPMASQYDIVLCLSVLHKLREPRALLDYACLKARRWLAVRVPGRIVKGLSVADLVLERGFELVSQDGPRPLVLIFRGP